MSNYVSNKYVLLTPNVAVDKDELVGSSSYSQTYNFANRLKHADLRIDDLDRQLIWYNIGERIASERIGVDSFSDMVSYLVWGLEGVGNLHRCLRQKKHIWEIETLKENHWKEYHELFLRDPYNTLEGYSDSLKDSVVDSIEKMLTKKEIAKSLFPGVRELNSKLETTNVLLSRNLEPILKAYAEELNYDSYVGDAYDKASALKDVLDKYPDKRRVILRGDGGKAEIEMINYAKKLQKQSRLDDVIPILREEQDNLLREDLLEFTIRVGTNDFGLLYLLNNYCL